MPYAIHDDLDDVDTGLPRPPHQIAVGSVQLDDADSLEVEEVSAADDDVVIDDESIEEQELDAFIEGKKRPSHLEDLNAALEDFSDLDD
jgi:hypothetical protein